jgi:hypothetical protein
MNFLKSHNIQTRKTYPQINKTTMYYETTTHLNSEYVSRCGLFLPSHTLLKDVDINYICDIIKLYYHSVYMKNNNNLFLTLSCYNSEMPISGWYVTGKNTGMGNMLFQVASSLIFAYVNNAILYVPALNTYLKCENINKEDSIFRKINTQKTINFDEVKNLYHIPGNMEYIHDHKFINNMVLSNYFENYNNFDGYKNIILDYFRPSDNDIKYILNKYPNIKDDNICSIHVRRGIDHLTLYGDNFAKQVESEYHKLLNHMIIKKNISNIFVFTDNKEYCKKIFDDNKIYKNINFVYSDEKDYIDIWMISLIKNNILSKSTLAWWGSYLNENKDKYILYSLNNITIPYYEWTSI